MKNAQSVVVNVIVALVIAAAAGTVLLVGMRFVRDERRSWQQRYELQQQMWSAIALLAGDSVQRVLVYRDWVSPGQPMLEVSGDEETRSFVAALQQATPWSPQHPSFEREFYVVVDLGEGHALEYMVCLQRDDVAYIDFVNKEGSTLLYFGHAQSRELYSWLKEVGLLGSGI